MEGTAHSIEELISQLLEKIPAEHIYKLAERNIDLVKLASSNPTSNEILTNYAIGGFIAGIRFALENIEARADEMETEGGTV